MYTLKTGFGKPLVGNGEWYEVDFAAMSIVDIFNNYRKAILVLTNPFVTGDVAFDIENLRYKYAASSKNISQFLIDNADNALETTTSIPFINERYAKYNDAFVAGYSVNATNPNTAPDSELTTGAKDWLHMSRTGLSYDMFKRHCLVTVNGMLHYADVGNDGIWIDNGMQSVEHSNQNHVGIISFAGISSLVTKRITNDMIHNQGANNQLGIRSYIETGIDLTDKTIGISLGGYLHILDNTTFHRVGNSRICIDFSNLPLFERYYESKRYIDFERLDLVKSDVNDSVIAVSDFLSDSVIRRYLELPQTFLIVFDNPELMVRRLPLDDTKLPGVYQTQKLPDYPLMGGFGRMVNYLTEHCGGVWNVLMTDTFKKRYMFNKVANTRNSVNVSDARVTEYMSEPDKFWFYLIGSNIDYKA